MSAFAQSEDELAGVDDAAFDARLDAEAEATAAQLQYICTLKSDARRLLSCRRGRRCHDKRCGICKTIKAYRQRDAFLFNVEQWPTERTANLFQVVLKSPPDANAYEAKSYLMGRFANLIDTRTFRKLVYGGYRMIHVVRHFTTELWHSHMHLMLEVYEGVTDEQMQSYFESAWSKDTFVRRVGNTPEDRAKLSRYDVKGGDGDFRLQVADRRDPEHVALLDELVDGLGRTQMFARIGGWRNSKSKPDRWHAVPRADPIPSSEGSQDATNATQDASNASEGPTGVRDVLGVLGDLGAAQDEQEQAPSRRHQVNDDPQHAPQQGGCKGSTTTPDLLTPDGRQPLGP